MRYLASLIPGEFIRAYVQNTIDFAIDLFARCEHFGSNSYNYNEMPFSTPLWTIGKIANIHSHLINA